MKGLLSYKAQPDDKMAFEFNIGIWVNHNSLSNDDNYLRFWLY